VHLFYSVVQHIPAEQYQPTAYTRSYSANSYLPLASTNLEILTNAQVAKINFANSGSKICATGITLANGAVICAQKEVTPSAGAFQTPNLLELSGISNVSVLAAANITQLVNLASVGENYQDHLRIQLPYQLRGNYTPFDILRHNTTVAADVLGKWIAGRPSRCDYTASGFLFVNWKQLVSKDGARKLVELARKVVRVSADIGRRKKLEQLGDATVPQAEITFSDGYTGVKGYPAVGIPLHGKGFFALIDGLMHPLSRGSVHINPTAPTGKPAIDPRFLDNECDLQQ